MYARRKKQSPFVCGAKSNGFAKIEDIFPTKSDNKDDEQLNLNGFEDSMIDAETGQPIKMSKARWNVKEGRLNLDTATILAMGTGRLDIRNRVHYEETLTSTPAVNSSKHLILESSPISRVPYTTHQAHSKLTPLNSASNIRQHTWDGMFSTISRASTAQSVNVDLKQDSSQPITPMNFNAAIGSPLSPLSLASPDQHFCRAPQGHKRHPLITKFLKSGPLKPIHHIHWDARSNEVLAQDEEGNPIDMAEEGVDYGSDEEDNESLALVEGSPAALFSQSLTNINVSTLPSGSSSVHSSYSGLSASTGSKAPQLKREKAKHTAGGTSSVNSAASVATKKTGGSSTSLEPADDPTVGLVDDAIGDASEFNLGIFFYVSPYHCYYSHVEQAKLASGGGTGLSGVVFDGLGLRAQQEPHWRAPRCRRPGGGAAAGTSHRVSYILTIILYVLHVYVCDDCEHGAHCCCLRRRLKVRAMKELVQASADEKIKEARRTVRFCFASTLCSKQYFCECRLSFFLALLHCRSWRRRARRDPATWRSCSARTRRSARRRGATFMRLNRTTRY